MPQRIKKRTRHRVRDESRRKSHKVHKVLKPTPIRFKKKHRFSRFSRLKKISRFSRFSQSKKHRFSHVKVHRRHTVKERKQQNAAGEDCEIYRNNNFGTKALNKRRDILYTYMDVKGIKCDVNDKIDEAVTSGNRLSQKALAWYKSSSALEDILNFSQRCGQSSSGRNESNGKEELIKLIRDNCKPQTR